MMWVEVDKKDGLACPVTWILLLSVSTSQHLVWTGLVSSLTAKRFPLEETSCAEPTSSQSSAPLFLSVLLFYYQWVRLYGKQGGDGRGKVWHLFLTQHMCVCLKCLLCQLGPLSINEVSATSYIGVWADVWERGRLDCGMWFTFCLFLLSAFT